MLCKANPWLGWSLVTGQEAMSTQENRCNGENQNRKARMLSYVRLARVIMLWLLIFRVERRA
jgi:hypothetical protein